MSQKELMDELVAEIKVCHRCRLWNQAKNAVPGEGSLKASLMLIGEAPGYWEDIKARPFVGAAGKILDDLLEGVGLKRGDVYIANIVKHRPPMNRVPRADEVEACVPYLDRQIQIIEPEIIVTLGQHSTRYILSKVNVDTGGITAVRGRIFAGEMLNLPVRIIPAFHPAAALYNPKVRSALEEDFRKIKTELEKVGQ